MGTNDRELLQSFHQTLPPAAPLKARDPRYWPIYEDHRLVPWDPVEQLKRGIEWQDQGTLQILVGPPECGKTTELLRLQHELEYEYLSLGFLIFSNIGTKDSPAEFLDKAAKMHEERRVLLIDQDTETLDTLSVDPYCKIIDETPSGELTHVVVTASGLNRNPHWTHPRVLDEPRRIEPLLTDNVDSIFASLGKYLDSQCARWRNILSRSQLEEIVSLSGGRIGTIFEILRSLATRTMSPPASDYDVTSAIAAAQKRLRSRSELTLQDLGSILQNGLPQFHDWNADEHAAGETIFRKSQLQGALLCRGGRFYINPLFERDVNPTWSPKPPADEHNSTVSTTSVAHIRDFRIENVRAFDDFHMEHRVPEDGVGQWTLLLGDNGVGKTTILRSLVLALSGQRTADALLRLQGASAPYLSIGRDHGSIEVRIDGRELRVELSRDERGIEIVDGDFENPFPVYAYGCQRGTALGGRNREADPSYPLEDVLTLFDPAANMIHAETWLRERKRVALQSEDGAEQAFFEAVLETIAESLEGVDKVTIETTGVWLKGPNVGRAPLAAMSDAYITTAGWLLDLIARWAERARRLEIPLAGDFREAMTGLVFLDEIDLHLHPLWQTRVVDDLRRLFPRLSFVATTHNPLTLHGAREGEIHVLRKDTDGRVVAVQRDIPKGTRADQILTGEWFGLVSTLDPETVDMLDRHRDMLRRQVPRDNKERKKLKQELQDRLETFEDLSLEGMVRGIMAELEPEDLQESSPEERRAFRERVLVEARKRKGTA